MLKDAEEDRETVIDSVGEADSDDAVTEKLAVLEGDSLFEEDGVGELVELSEPVRDRVQLSEGDRDGENVPEEERVAVDDKDPEEDMVGEAEPEADSDGEREVVKHCEVVWDDDNVVCVGDRVDVGDIVRLDEEDSEEENEAEARVVEETLGLTVSDNDMESDNEGVLEKESDDESEIDGEIVGDWEQLIVAEKESVSVGDGETDAEADAEHD